MRSSGTEGDEEGAGKPKKVSIAAVIALANERAKYKESLQAEREHVSVFACDSCGLWLGCDRAVCPQLAKDNDANLELYSDENLNKRTHLAKHDSVIAIILKVGCVPLVAEVSPTTQRRARWLRSSGTSSISTGRISTPLMRTQPQPLELPPQRRLKPQPRRLKPQLLERTQATMRLQRLVLLSIHLPTHLKQQVLSTP